MISNEKLGLRQIETSDLETLRDWRNRAHYKKYFREFRELTMQHQHKWYDMINDEKNRTLMFAIIELPSTDIIGVCGLAYINWIHRHADLSIYIGKDNLYIDTEKNGIAWQTLDLLLGYGFNELNLHKIWSEIYEFDEKKHELFSKYGMQCDGILRDNYFYDGKYQNSHIYSIISKEWNAQRQKNYQ